MKQWPILTLRKADSLDQARANAVTSSNLRECYNLLAETLNKHARKAVEKQEKAAEREQKCLQKKAEKSKML